jgi:anaerobic ribonucleoside-triphosphate reductase activating protein
VATTLLVNLHAMMPRSRANGPGTRFALWFQGCSLACPGCFNPATHAGGPATHMAVDDLVERILAEGDAIEGVTISGGEPFEQPHALLELTRDLRRRAPGLSILVFSGFSRQELEREPACAAVLAHIDVLVDGRFVLRRKLGRGMRGSDNQIIHLLTSRYSLADIEATPIAEVVIDADGTARLSGVAPIELEATAAETAPGAGPEAGHRVVR